MPESKDSNTIKKIKKIFGNKNCKVNFSYYNISINYTDSEQAMNNVKEGLGSELDGRLTGVNNPDNFKTILHNVKRNHVNCFKELEESIPKNVKFSIVRKANTWTSPATYRWGLKISFKRSKPGYWKNW